MPETININTEIFKWARNELNLTIEDIAHKMKKDEQVILDWETGEKTPTYKQLEKLSYKIFKIPIATFFLSNSPDSVSLEKDFRTLPNDVIQGVSYETRLAIKRSNYLISVLKEVFTQNTSDQKIIKELKTNLNNTPEKLASNIRSYLEIYTDTKFEFKNSYQAFNYYRNRIEEKGIYIFQFKLEGDRAFCLYDDEFPVIVVNSGDSINSRIFSLFHELSHLLLSESDIYIDGNTSSYHKRSIEIFCNKVSSEVLLPEQEFLNFFFEQTSGNWTETFIKKAAKTFSVSKEVIMRKLLDLNIVSDSDYKYYKHKWDEEFKNRNTSGGSYYRNVVSSLGKKFIGEMLSSYRKGLINDNSAKNYLGVKLSNFGKLETELYS